MIVTLAAGRTLKDAAGEFSLPAELKLTLPTIKFGVMGPPNTGKSRLIASMETPLLVLLADPMEKAECYFDRGFVDDETYTGQWQQPIRVVRDKPKALGGKGIIQVECFLDPNPTIPWGFTALQNRLDQVAAEVREGKWKSVGLDSWSQIEYIAKLRRSTGAFAGVDSVHAALKDDCEQLLKSRLCTLPCNVGVALHINTKMIDTGGGTMMYEPVATGTLKSGIGSVLGEMYRSDSAPDQAVPGGLRYALQTTRDSRFDCGTRIGAPNGCPNDFKALFSNWIVRKARMVLAAEQSTNLAPADAAAPKE